MNPEETLNWYVSNASGVDVVMGVRMVGYLDATQRRMQGQFGG
jgi:hypothetical protein